MYFTSLFSHILRRRIFMSRWILYRTHQGDLKSRERFIYLSKKLKGFAQLVWLFDGDSSENCSFDGTLPEHASAFKSSEDGMSKLWPDLLKSYFNSPIGTPRIFPKNGDKIRSIKWSLGHLPALEWWISTGRPRGRFMVWEHDMWWEDQFNPLAAIQPAFRHHKFLAQPVKRYNPGPDTVQPPIVNCPNWLKPSMVCHYTATIMSDNLMGCLDDLSKACCWSHCELFVPSVAHHHPKGGGCASWMRAAPSSELRKIIHRFPGQTKNKSPQKIFNI